MNGRSSPEFSIGATYVRRACGPEPTSDLHFVKQYVGEIDWTPSGSKESLRLVVPRQIIDRYEGKQGRLTDSFATGTS